MDITSYIQTGSIFNIVQIIPQSLLTDTVTVSIMRLSDGFTWNFTTLKFGAVSSSGNMGYVSDILWKQSFTPDQNDTYVVIIDDVTLDTKFAQYLIAQGGTITPSPYMSSKVVIANLALGEIGAQLISTFTEDSSSARQISLWYDPIRDEILCEHPWSFATKRAVLATLTGTPEFTDDNLSNVYALPSDFLKIVAISDYYATFRIENGDHYGVPLVLLSDTKNLKIKYIYRNDNPSSYFPKFITALASRLAGKICFNLTESAKKSEMLQQRYTKIDLPSAESEDSRQGTPDQPAQSDWEIARFLGAGSVIAPPGAQTWHTVFQ